MDKIFLIGYMGCGKTTFGRILAARLNMSFVDLDAFIEEKEFKSIGQIFEEKGEDEFRKIEHTALLEVCEFQNTVISTGGGVPCFFDNMQIMNEQGLTIYLQVTPEKLTDTLKKAKKNRPLIKDKSEAELLAFIQENLGKRTIFYSQAKLTIDPDNDLEEIVLQISGDK